ncbi:Histidine kinase-, DNA gyrase B [Arachis hypogaea]|nr:Histidine kinase-, DNA gyrase B [Arachis hypogaea]
MTEVKKLDLNKKIELKQGHCSYPGSSYPTRDVLQTKRPTSLGTRHPPGTKDQQHFQSHESDTPAPAAIHLPDTSVPTNTKDLDRDRPTVSDDGGGMDPETTRHCMSFGFSNKKSKLAIGQNGNGFETSTMRLGADVIVFSRHMSNGILTQSIGLLSYTFLVQEKLDRIVVPMIATIVSALLSWELAGIKVIGWGRSQEILEEDKRVSCVEELLVKQLLKLNTIEVEGEVKLQRKVQD